MVRPEEPPGFDAEALQGRYDAERAKRLRRDGTDQYRHVQGAFSRYDEDPYVSPGFARDPVVSNPDVLIVGGGFGGLLQAARLREAGIIDILIVEKAGDFGGTWYWNRYPGAACDIESYVYIPLLEELNYVPVEKYAKGPEILAHAQAVGRKYDLYGKALFQTEIRELRWDDRRRRWIADTDRNDTIAARYVCMSTGPLNKPKLPGIAGIETFGGHAFHTSRWDYDYTGGGPEGGLSNLADKRVAIIGTGATAIQCIPHLAEGARHLYVFQRTPSVVDARNNRPTDPQWAGSLKPGWQQRRMDNFNTLVSGGTADEDLVSDGWTEILHGIGVELASMPDEAERRQRADFRKMEQIRDRIDRTVSDKATAAALKPYYNIMCKRPCFHDAYLETFNRENVTLVDTDGRGVDRVTPSGVVANGREFPVDCLIYATGFEFQTDFAIRNGYQIYGRGGLTLSEKWKDGASTLHGYFIRDFPNCFILGNAQTANTPNFTHMLNESSRHLAWTIKTCLERQISAVEPSQDAERAWVDHILTFRNERRKFDRECTPGYYNNEGQPSDKAVLDSFYPAGPLVFVPLLEAWRDKGDLEGLEQLGA